MRRGAAGEIAFGGVMAALAVSIQSFGTLIPVMTFLCPVICMLILSVVLTRCGKRIAWAWYGTVSILGAILAPDKEAAALFLFLGYYPIIKPWLDSLRLRVIWKALLFYCTIGVMYVLLIFILGMESILTEFRAAGIALGAVCLALGGLVFFLVDYLLKVLPARMGHIPS